MQEETEGDARGENTVEKMVDPEDSICGNKSGVAAAAEGGRDSGVILSKSRSRGGEGGERGGTGRVRESAAEERKGEESQLMLSIISAEIEFCCSEESGEVSIDG